MYKTRNTGTGNGMRGMEGMLYSGECPETVWGMSSNIPGNVCVTQGNDDVVSVQDFIVLFLCVVKIKRIRRQGEPQIPLCNPSGGKLLLRTSSY